MFKTKENCSDIGYLEKIFCMKFAWTTYCFLFVLLLWQNFFLTTHTSPFAHLQGIGLGMLSAITPGENISEPVFCHSTEVRSTLTFPEIPFRKYRKPTSCRSQACVNKIDQMNPILPSLTTAKTLNNICMASYYVSDPSKYPSWF